MTTSADAERQTPWVWYRFHTDEEDFRPMKFPPPGPFWCTGCSGWGSTEENPGYSIVVAYLPPDANLYEWWPDATEVYQEGRTEIRFTERFPQPDWWPPEPGTVPYTAAQIAASADAEKEVDRLVEPVDAGIEQHTSGIPFSGATMMAKFHEGEEKLFVASIDRLMTCGHDHNFMIAKDGMMLFMSPLAAECIKPVIGREGT